MKTIIREIIAMIILLAAIILVLVMFFFDYIKADSNQPQAATYKMSEEEANIIKEKEEYENSQNRIVLSSGYTVTEEQLKEYKASGELKTGQTNPFDETPITDVLYDGEGNAFFKVINNRSEQADSTNKWYGTVSGDSRGITTTTVTTSDGSTMISTKNDTVETTPTQVTSVPQTTTTVSPVITPSATPQATSKATPTASVNTTRSVYDPTRDITAPSPDSGNLSQSTGKK